MVVMLRQCLIRAGGHTGRAALSSRPSCRPRSPRSSRTHRPPSEGLIGNVQPGRDRTLGGLAHLNLGPVGPPLGFTFVVNGPAGAPTGFRIDLRPDGHLHLPDGLQAATTVSDGGRERLVPAPGPVRLWRVGAAHRRLI